MRYRRAGSWSTTKTRPGSSKSRITCRQVGYGSIPRSHPSGQPTIRPAGERIMTVDARIKLQQGLEGRYRIERELGRGGMATVYLAQDLRHDRPVALKVLRSELAATLGPERFQREIHVTARL